MIGGSEAARLYVSVTAEIRDAMANMRAMDRQVDASTSLVKKANPILQGIGQGMGLAAVGSAALATRAVTEMVFDTIDAASDLRESISLSDQVFEKNSQSMQAWAGGAADAFGQSTDEALSFAAGFGTAFKNVGMDIETASQQSKALTELAADLGSAFNRSSEEAATALRSGLLGETEPMRRFGVFLSEAAVQAKAVELGIADAGEELSDTQKVAARYAIIMEDTADSQGMMGRDSESLADAQKELGAAFRNLGASVGEILLPMMVDLAQFVNEVGIPAFEDWAESASSLAENTGKEVDFIGGKIQEAENLFERLTPWDDWIPGTELMHDGMTNIAEAMGDLSNFAGKAEDDLVHLPPAFDFVADGAATMASRIVRSNADVIASYAAMRDRMTSAAAGAADAIYGPMIAQSQLEATEREIAAQREIVASGGAASAQISHARDVAAARAEAIADQIAGIQDLQDAETRAFDKSMEQFDARIAAQFDALDAADQARRMAKRDADLARSIADAQVNVVTASQPNAQGVLDPKAMVDAQERLNDLLAQQDENRIQDAANARRDELRELQDQINAITEHEREAVDKRKALAEAKGKATSIASQIATAREAGDLERVADLYTLLEAQKTEIAHLASEARNADRVTELERQKEQIEEAADAMQAASASGVEEAKARIVELNATKIEQLALLASFGDEAAAEALASSAEIQHALITGNDEVKASILELQHELFLLKLTALELAGLLDFSDPFGPNADHVSGPGISGTRAYGGPVNADEAYLVGENGRELFVPDSHGSVRPIGPPQMDMPSGDVGGGNVTLAPNIEVRVFVGDQELTDIIDVQLMESMRFAPGW